MDKDTRMAAVERTALKQGWHVIAYYKHRHVESTIPHGVIAFVRNDYPFGDKRCGTAQWCENDLGVLFQSGHYDLTRDEAMESFAERVEDRIKN